MTTHHPNPENGKSPSTPDDYADAMNYLSDSARDMQSMHTRLADLLDQVSVSSPSIESAASSSQQESSPYQEPLSSFQETLTDSNGDLNLNTESPFSTVTPATTEAVAPLSTETSEQISSSIVDAEHSALDGVTENGSYSFDNSVVENLGDTFDPANERPFDDIGRSDMSRDDAPASSDKLDGLPITGSQPDAPNSAITIKGRTDGISIEIGAGSWRMLMVQLRHRLHQSSGFFRGGVVSLDVGERSLTQDELTNAQGVLDEHGLKLGMVRTLSQETSQSAGALGISVTLDQPAASISQTASTNHETLAHFVYRGNLRSGQILRRAETILVLGDVNPGALVESEADILVWGRLRGIAHAGMTGDVNAIVAAMSMEPTQLRITDTIAIMPATDERRGLFGAKKRNPDLAPRPEIAYIADNTIVVEPWDESKPGGIMAFRRS